MSPLLLIGLYLFGGFGWALTWLMVPMEEGETRRSNDLGAIVIALTWPLAIPALILVGIALEIADRRRAKKEASA